MWEDGAGSFRALGLVKDFAQGSRQPLNDFKQRKDAGHAVFGSNMRASGDYRKLLAEVLIKRAVQDILAQDQH